jgi:hypothetical protein
MLDSKLGYIALSSHYSVVHILYTSIILIHYTYSIEYYIYIYTAVEESSEFLYIGRQHDMYHVCVFTSIYFLKRIKKNNNNIITYDV